MEGERWTQWWRVAGRGDGNGMVQTTVNRGKKKTEERGRERN